MNQAQFDDVERLAHLGCWEWDVRANRVTWTEGLYRIYGLDAASFGATYEGYLERVHPEDRERVAATVADAYRHGGTFDFEERIVRPDGAVRWLRSRGHVERAADGQALRLLGVCHDVTDLQAAREEAVRAAAEAAALREADRAAARLNVLADASAVLASSLDYEQTLRNVARLAVPRIADWCAVDLAAGAGALRRVAVEHPDPARVRLAYRLQEEYPPRSDESNGSLRVLATGETELGRDVPDELLVAAAHDAEHLAILRGLGLRSWVVAPLRTQDRVLGVMTFVHAESGRVFSEADLPLLEDLARRAAVAIENAELVRELERARERLSAQMLQLSHQAEQLENQAGELEMQSEELQQTLHELELRNAELERARAAAELANRAKSDFLATMSHELRTPLNAIGGYAELIQMGVHGAVTAGQLEALDRIQRNQRRLLSLITDILNFARIEAGRLHIVPTATPVAAIVEDLEALTAPQATDRGLTLEFAPVPDVVVEADPERAEQVLLNLLGNAIKFTEPGGTVRLSCAVEERLVQLHVADNGPGIPPDRLDDIFDPFVQLGPQRTRESQGVGLGLSISRELARAMGGDITVESQPGQGATFVFTLPRAAAAAGS